MSDEMKKTKIHVGLFIAGLVDVESSPHPDGGSFLEGKVVVYDDRGNCFTLSEGELTDGQRDCLNLFAQELLCEKALLAVRAKLKEFNTNDVVPGTLFGGGNDGGVKA